MLDRVDLALASRLIGQEVEDNLIAFAQRALDGIRSPSPTDAEFLISLLRLRGFIIDDEEAGHVLAGRESRISSLSQEFRLLRGLQDCLAMVRQRAAHSIPPDGWFLVELFRTMAKGVPRFRNNDLRRSPPWDALLYINYPPPEQLRFLIDSFDNKRCYRDAPVVFNAMHPVRQGFRMMWRFARIAPFPDFNTVIAWLGLNAWLQSKGYPLLKAQRGDQQLLSKLLGGPPPTKIIQYEARLLASFEVAK
ncbi:hypothetical protein N8467_00760 [bacterium]|jgi:hypothetical protein|nr:hypothetical protein [bacterium]